MATMSPSNRLCLQPNFPWHTLNSECNTASLRMCASLCMFEQVSAHFSERTKCNWFAGSWQRGPGCLKPGTTNTHPPAVNYCMTDIRAITQQQEDKTCWVKTQPLSQTSVILFVTTAQVQLLRVLTSWVSGCYTVHWPADWHDHYCNWQPINTSVMWSNVTVKDARNLTENDQETHYDAFWEFDYSFFIHIIFKKLKCWQSSYTLWGTTKLE